MLQPRIAWRTLTVQADARIVERVQHLAITKVVDFLRVPETAPNKNKTNPDENSKLVLFLQEIIVD